MTSIKAALLALMAVVGLIAMPSAANATATVNNQFACTRSTGHCWQTNGAYVSSVQNTCWWTDRSSSRYDLYYTLCDRWVPAPSGY